MIRLGLRLTIGSGREAALRVLVTSSAVALGVGLLLACLAGSNGLHAQTERGAWLDTAAQESRSAVEHRPIRIPSDRPRGCCRDRAERSGPARASSPAGTGRILRFARPHDPPEVRTGQRTARPISGAPDRDHRCSGATVTELADHRRRPQRAPTLEGTRSS